RKNSPGVTSSPTPSATATSTQTSHPTLETLVEAECHGPRAQAADPAGHVGGTPLPVDEHGRHADRTCSLDVVLDRVADHRGVAGVDVEQLEHAQEDRLMRLRLSVRARGEHGVDHKAVMLDEQIEIPGGVREEADLQPTGAQRL